MYISTYMYMYIVHSPDSLRDNAGSSKLLECAGIVDLSADQNDLSVLIPHLKHVGRVTWRHRNGGTLTH